MPLIRTAIITGVYLLYSVSATAAQETKNVSLRDGSRSFNVARGSSFSASGPVGRDKATGASPIVAITTDFGDALEIVRNNYASTRKTYSETVLKSSIGRMLHELDPHSSYFTQAEFQDLNDENRGRYFGTGMSISNFTRAGEVGTFVLSVTKGSPAEQAGIRFGDCILCVDGKDVAGESSDTVGDMVRGAEGTYATITYERGTDTVHRTVRLRRTKLPESSVPTAIILDQNVAYIDLTIGFHYTTAGEFSSALARLKAEGARSLIVDLRGNGGGILEQAIKIAQRFLPAGRVIVSQRGRNPVEDRVWRSTNRDPETLPLVLLVDENTASASEVFAAAMQDNDRATIVGGRTFGKGLVQDVIPLEDGSGLVLTSERYYAPSGRSLQREYSDSGLYDYFRNVKKGALIDRPETATRTLKGRVVHGGDGIQPDITVPTKQWTRLDQANYDAAFFKIQKNQAGIIESLNAYERLFAAASKGNLDLVKKASLEGDAQFMTALNVLLRSK